MYRCKSIVCGNRSIRLVYSVLMSSVLCLALLCAWAVPYFGGADERLHLDYAWQLSRGNLPNFHEGAKVPLYRRPPPVQFVAHHPPLYYALQAPAVRYFVDGKGDINSAAMAARIVNISLGVLCVAALVWLGGLVSNRSMLYRVGVPAIFCGFLPFVKVASLIFNDVLALVFAILGIGLAWRMTSEGPSRMLVCSLAVVSALGMATRATHASVLVVGLLSIVLHYSVVKRMCLWETVRRSILPVSTVLAAVCVAVGWFYLRNYSLSGSWTRVAPQSWAIVMDREYKDITRVLSEVRMWLFPFLEPYGKLPVRLRWFVIAPPVAGLLSLFCVVVYRARSSCKAEQWVGGALLGLLVLLSYAQQIVHATGYGAFNPRYLMLVYLVLAFCIVRALSELSPRVSTIMLTFFTICSLVGAVMWSTHRIPQAKGNAAASSWLERAVHEMCVVKQVPMFLVIVCCVGLLGGIILQLLLWHREARLLAQSRSAASLVA
jgi:hypothetical protein